MMEIVDGYIGVCEFIQNSSCHHLLYYYRHYPIFKCVKYNNKYNNKYNINVLLIRKFPLHTLNPKSNINSEPKLK